MANKTALVLSGGGFKGAFQVGVLQYLKNNWSKIDPTGGPMKFDLIAGVSVGSLNGVLLASDKFEELEKLWDDVAKNGVEEIYTSDFIDTQSKAETVQFKINFPNLKKTFFPNLNLKNIPGKLFKIILNREGFFNEVLDLIKKDLGNTLKSFKSIADNTPLKNKLTTLVKQADIKTKYSCGYVSLNDGQYYSVNSNDFASDADFVNGVLASTAMPIVWPPVESINTKNQINNNNQQKYSVDGGIRNVSPLSDVIKEINNDPGNDYLIIIINCHSGEVKEENYQEKGIASIALRSLNDIALTEVFNNDIAEFLKINDILAQVNAIKPNEPIYNFDTKTNRRSTQRLKHFNAIIIQPDGDTLGDSLVATEGLIQKRLGHGQFKAQQALNTGIPLFV